MIEGTLAEVTVNSSTFNRRKDVGQPRHGRASSWYLAIASGCAGPRHLVSSTRETAQFEATELQRGGPRLRSVNCLRITQRSYHSEVLFYGSRTLRLNWVHTVNLVGRHKVNE